MLLIICVSDGLPGAKAGIVFDGKHGVAYRLTGERREILLKLTRCMVVRPELEVS